MTGNGALEVEVLSVEEMQVELEFLRERLRKEQATVSEQRKELLLISGNLRQEQAINQEIGLEKQREEEKAQKLSAQLENEIKLRKEAEQKNKELRKANLELRKELEFTRLDYELELEDYENHLALMEHTYYEQRSHSMALMKTLAELEGQHSLLNIDYQGLKLRTKNNVRNQTRKIREYEHEMVELRKSLTVFELEARAEMALRTAAEFKLQQINALEFNEEEERNFDYSNPRLLGTRPLSFQRKKASNHRSEKDRKFSLPSVRSSEGWVVEAPRAHSISESVSYEIEQSELSMRHSWFLDHFYGHKDHRTFVGGNREFGPIIISLVLEGPKRSLVSGYKAVIRTQEPARDSNYKAIIRTQEGEDFVMFPSSAVRVAGLRTKPSSMDTLRVIDPKLVESDLNLTEISDKDRDGVVKDLLNYEEKVKIKGYKFGILYCKQGQEAEEDMFSNVSGSPAFDRFLECLGQKVRLKEWPNYRAGLDVATDTTGTHSIYTQHGGFEVMFHVSTLLPHRDFDKQQLERKRHIGNDIGVIVYREGKFKDGYKPTTIESEFNHILVVVDAHVEDPNNPNDAKDRFSLSVAAKESVPLYGPPLPSGAVFKRDGDLRKVILTKLINGEMAAYKADVFSSKFRRTRAAMFQNLVDSYTMKS